MTTAGFGSSHKHFTGLPLGLIHRHDKYPFWMDRAEPRYGRRQTLRVTKRLSAVTTGLVAGPIDTPAIVHHAGIHD
jgi:hypothetical protein